MPCSSFSPVISRSILVRDRFFQLIHTILPNPSDGIPMDVGKV
jgi:hypothetical protein